MEVITGFSKIPAKSVVALIFFICLGVSPAYSASEGPVLQTGATVIHFISGGTAKITVYNKLPYAMSYTIAFYDKNGVRWVREDGFRIPN